MCKSLNYLGLSQRIKGDIALKTQKNADNCWTSYFIEENNLEKHIEKFDNEEEDDESIDEI